MAKEKASTAATPENATNGTEATVKPKKAKREKIFGGNTSTSEIRKREQKLTAKFNRLGNTVKAMGLSAENQTAILDILGKEYSAAAEKVFKGEDVEETKVADAPFV